MWIRTVSAKAIQPWNPNFIAIKPAGVIGEIQPAIEDSELIEEDNVDYINAGNGIRISKWRTGASTGQTAGEYTEGVLPVTAHYRDGADCLRTGAWLCGKRG